MSEDPQPSASQDDEPPPFLGKWRNAYAAVIGLLFALIVLFYLFGKAWS